MKNQFKSTLRLNLLEILDFSKTRKNRKRYSLADILGQLHAIYQVAPKKPSTEEIADALEYLLARELVDSVMIGDVEMYYISDDGKDLLKRIGEGDDTAVI